jgi:hypothetical protein
MDRPIGEFPVRKRRSRLRFGMFRRDRQRSRLRRAQTIATDSSFPRSLAISILANAPVCRLARKF